MGIVAKQASLNTAVIFAGTIFGAVNTILVLPNAFSEDKAALGFIGFMVSTAMISAQFVSLGSFSILVNFMAKSDNERYKNGLVSGLALSCLAALVVFTSLFLVTEETVKSYLSESDAMYYSIYRAPILVFTGSLVFFNLFSGYLSARFKTVLITFLLDPFTKLSYLAVALAFFFGYIGYSHLIYLLVGSYAFIALAAFFRSRKYGYRWTSPSVVSHVKEIIKYGYYSLLDKGAGVIIQKLDILMVSLILGFGFAGEFMIAFFIGSVVVIPFRAVQTIVNPILSKEVAIGNAEKLKGVYQRTAMYSFLLGAIIFGCLWVSIDEVLLILPEKFRNGKWVIFFIGISKLIQVLGSVSAGFIVYSKYYKFVLRLNLMLLGLTVISNILLITSFGLNGAAAATALTLFIFSIVKVVYVKNKFSMVPITKKLASAVVFVGFLTWGMSCIEFNLHAFVSIALKSMLYSGALLAFVLVFKITPYIKSYSELKRLISGK